MIDQHPPPDLVSLLELRAGQAPHRPAFRYLGATAGATDWSYGELYGAADAVARLLRDRGVEPGDRVMLLFPPGLEFIDAFLGSLLAGAIVVPAPPPNPLKPHTSLQRLQAIRESARPSHALTTRKVLAALQPALADMPSFAELSWVCSEDAPPPTTPGAPLHRPAPSDVAMIQYTSGSTSDPRGAALTHANILHNLRYFDVGWDHSPDSVALNWLPAFHDLGLIYGILAPIWGGFVSYQMSPIDVIQKPLAWLQAISAQHATHSCGPNFIYELCVRKVAPSEVRTLDLRSWRMALTAAEPVRPETIRRFAAHFAPAGFNPSAICPGYGLSEATCKVVAVPWYEQATVLRLSGAALERHEVALAAPDQPAVEVVGCGRPEFGVDVAITDPETGRRLPRGKVGEIWISGPSIASSYWNEPEATRTHLRATSRPGDPVSLRTGDLGFVHDGQLYITGRIKDMIIVRGANHYPQDIEYTVQDAHSAIRAGCVVAFAIEGAHSEELVIVAEVDRHAGPPEPVEDDDGLRRAADRRSTTAISTAIVKAVSEVHGLRAARVVLIKAGTICKTTSGKVQRNATRLQLLAGELAVVHDDRRRVPTPAVAIRDHIRSRVTDIVSEVGAIPYQHLRPHECLHGLGVDSLAGVNIAYEIGLMIGHDVPSGLLDQHDTIEKIVDYVVTAGAPR